MREVNLDRENHDKKPFGDNSSPEGGGKKKDNTSKKKLANREKEAKKRTVTKSTTDPDCGLFVKVSSVPQGISDKKHNFVLCRAIFCLCGNRFRFLCFVISYKKAQKSRPAIKAFCLYTGRPAMPSFVLVLRGRF